MVAYGTEAMHVLRAEKGYIIVGQETDGTVTPDDAGLGWAIGKAKPDFVGKRSLSRPGMTAPDRKQLVAARGGPSIGHVSSSYHSANLGRSIALALVRGGRALEGQRLVVPMPGREIAVEVMKPVFIDISHRQIGYGVSGADAETCLASGCPLDLALTAFPIGGGTRTLFHKAEIVLWRTATHRFHVEMWRSFASYVYAHLTMQLAPAAGGIAHERPS